MIIYRCTFFDKSFTIVYFPISSAGIISAAENTFLNDAQINAESIFYVCIVVLPLVYINK